MKFNQYGNKIDCAMLEMCQELGGDYFEIRGNGKSRRSNIFEFESEVKAMGTMVEDQKNGYLLCVKGEAVSILRKCSKIQHEDCSVGILDENEKEKIHSEIIMNMSESGLTSITIAYKRFPIGIFHTS